MFGFSLAEFILVIIVAIIFIKPQDLPEIAHFLGRVFFRLKKRRFINYVGCIEIEYYDNNYIILQLQ